ncbi:uncharacterized protein RCC_08245 [Ramularia collo-cygni]|uniref:Glucosamine 6-phosphate N-acetyltransferase n=1 Tax=Ramularia collo-cygni TaxID=112498 RepID=A0A2D3VES1_9PEZI|nr:uncharacterized protein RCC_08245 [Ramularia collo-cygni]CZT22376.1 uncharacterized protein RCC_08245 [Ramularia collo-cygni]
MRMRKSAALQSKHTAADVSLLQRRHTNHALAKIEPISAEELFLRPDYPDSNGELFDDLDLVPKTRKSRISFKPTRPVKRVSKPLAAAVAADTPLFPIEIDSAVSKKLPEGYRIRSLQRSDYSKGYTKLKGIGKIKPEAWDARCEYMRSRSDVYTILVIANDAGRVCCTGTLVLERKLTYDMSIVGHIEDIIVAEGHRGKNLSYRMLSQLDRIAYAAGATRTIACTQSPNIPFYAQKNFVETGIEMTRSFVSGSDAEDDDERKQGEYEDEDEERDQDGDGDEERDQNEYEERNKSRSPSFDRLDAELASSTVRLGEVKTSTPRPTSSQSQSSWSVISGSVDHHGLY